MRNELVKFNFHGSELDVVRDGEDVWVSVRRVCEALGVDNTTQQSKLNAKPWARTTLLVAEFGSVGQRPTGAENKLSRELYLLHLDSLAMWLATIDAERVKEAVRPRVEDFQLHCAKVLRDHFFPRAIPVHAPAPALPAVVNGPILRDDTERRKLFAILARAAARSQNRTLQAVYGYVRRKYHAPSPFAVSLLFWETMHVDLEDLACGRVQLTTPRALRQSLEDLRQVSLFPATTLSLPRSAAKDRPN